MAIASIKKQLYLALPVACALFAFAIAPPAAAGQPLAELAKPGRLLMLRHATAPGNGDPPGFRLDDCATQRNLDTEGRRQAAELGQRLARAGIVRARVYQRAVPLPRNRAAARPWPGRAAAGAELLLPAPRRTRVAARHAQGFLARLPTDGLPVVLVTHQFTITGFTSGPTASGGGSLFQLNGSGNPQWWGRSATVTPAAGPCRAIRRA